MPLLPSDLLHLGNVPLFNGLSAAELTLVDQITQTRTSNAFEYVFYQGDPASHIYLVMEGRVKLSQITTDGQQILLRILSAWNIFAIIGLTSNAPYPISAQTIESSRLAYWKKEHLKDLVRRIPQLALNSIDIMAVYVQEFQDRFRELATERVERRLARTLLRLASQSGTKTNQGVLIDMPLTRQALAEMIGTTLFTVSRILSAWEGQHIVHSGRERISILAPHQLVQIAEDIPSI